MIRFTRHLAFWGLAALTAFQAAGQAPNGAWVYPSASGNLLYQLDSRGQRINDFSQCGYRAGTEPLPNVSALIPQSRWVYVSPGSGDDTALIQSAIDSVEAMTPDANGWRGVVYLNAGEYQLASTLTINASGVVLKGAGDSPTSGTRLRATDARQYTLISVGGSGSRSTVANTTHDLTQKLVPAGARTFEVDDTTGLAVGHTVIVKRPSTAEWIADIDMDQLGPAPVVPWTAGSKDLIFDRTITRIDGNWITVDIPLPQTFESQYGGGQIWRYTWSGRIRQVGIEDLYGFSDYASSTDENHGWYFITMANLLHGWVRNITAQYFGYSAVTLNDGVKWVTVADSQCLDPISIIDGGRRYSFNNNGGECCLFLNDYARKGRHDFVFGATVSGPNAFVHCTADTAYSDTGPHQRWSVGGLFDQVTVNGDEINVRNRGNSGTGHGWAGAYMTLWNCKADGFRVRNPPTARNWLVGSIGTIGTSSGFSVGADPAGTYDSSGPSGTGKAVFPNSLYYGQLQQRMKWPGSEFREVWLGDVDQHFSTGGAGNPVNCDASWLAQVEALDTPPADTRFDYLVAGARHTACTLDFPLDPGDAIVAASLTVSLRGTASSVSTDNLWLDSTTSPQSYSALGWTPVSTTAPTVRTIEVSPSLLADGRLNLAFGTNTAVDFVVLNLQVQKAQPASTTLTLNPVADAHVTGGANSTTNYGTATTLTTKEDSNADFDRETFLRWDLSGVGGKILQAKVRLVCTGVGQAGNENCATLVSDDAWGETTINFSNKPASGKLFAQWLPVAGQAVEFDLTPQVLSTLSEDGKLSLRVLSTGAYGTNGIVNYASRESATTANRPQLILTIEQSGSAIKAATGSALNLAPAWTPAFAPVNPGTATWDAGSLAGAMTLGADLNWGGLIVNNPAGPLTFNGSQFLTLGGAGIDMSAATVDLTLNHAVVLGESQTWTIGAGRILAANGPLSGPWSLTKSGTGSLVFSAANTYTGTTAIQQGTLQVGAGGTLGAIGGTLTMGTGSPGVIGTTGSLVLNTNATVGAVEIRSNTSDITSPGNINLLSIASGSTLTASSFTVGVTGSTGAGNTLTALGTGAAGSGGTLRINGSFNMSRSGGANTTDAAITSVDLSGLLALNIQAPAGSLSVGSNLRSRGTLTLANNSNTLNVGTLSLGDTGSNSSGMSTLNLGAGTNALQAPVIIIGAGKAGGLIQFGGPGGSVVITGAGGSGSSTISIGNASTGTYTGGNNSLLLAGHPATITAGTVTIGQKSGSSSGNVGAFMTFDTGTFTANAVQMGVAGGTSSGNINSSFTVGGPTADSTATGVVNLAGNLLLAAATGGSATPTSALILNGGSVNVNTVGSASNGIFDTSTGAGASTTTLTLAGGRLNLNGGSIGGTTGTGRRNIGTLNFHSGTLSNVASINGSDGLTKTTAGTLTLSGTHGYTGATQVNAGTVVLSGSLAGPVIVNTGGTLAPRGLPLSSGDLNLNPGGTYRTLVNGPTAGTQYDQLTAGASVTLNGSLDLVPGPGLAPGTSFTILNKTSSGAISGAFAGRPEGSAFVEDGYTWIISYLGGDGNDVIVTLATPVQAWRFAYFGTISNSGNAADNFDANGDGELNLLEYATAQDPGARTRALLTPVRTVGAFEITYTRSKTALTAGVTFDVEWSDTLAPGSWSTNGVTHSILSDNGSLQSVRAVISAGPSIPMRYARLRVTQAP